MRCGLLARQGPRNSGTHNFKVTLDRLWCDLLPISSPACRSRSSYAMRFPAILCPDVELREHLPMQLRAALFKPIEEPESPVSLQVEYEHPYMGISIPVASSSARFLTPCLRASSLHLKLQVLDTHRYFSVAELYTISCGDGRYSQP